MTTFTCLAKFLVDKKKKYMKSLKAADCKACCIDVELHVEPIKLYRRSAEDESSFVASKYFPTAEKSYSIIPKTASMGTLVITEFGGDEAYEVGDEHDVILPVKRYHSDFNLQAKQELVSPGSRTNLNNYNSEHKVETNEGIVHSAMIADGYASDAWMEQTVFWGSTVFNESKRSAKRSTSHSDHISLSENDMGEFHHHDHSMPLSIKTPCNADRLILQKRSSCQEFVPRSRNIWRNLCPWSDVNLDKSCAPQSLATDHNATYEKLGYSSDICELAEQPNEKKEIEIKNQCIAFSLQSSSDDRVYSWINSLEECTFSPTVDDDSCDGKEGDGIASLHHLEKGESSGKNHSYNTPRAREEMIQASNIIQFLNSFSSVAHLSNLGLKIVPSLSAFGSLRSVSLSRNFIVHITTGCLPKNIHTLDLSRNMLSTIEGLRDLTRLRVLNLSHNRISRIGHGLSSCTVIKELYLAGNWISDVEGLHRLLKLSVLDLSFNKITTAKALSQLVANYSSLFSLNLLGNPIQGNVGDDHLRKAVISILPHIRYLNKQPIKQHRAREAAANCVIVGDGRWTSRRRPTRRLAQGPGSSAKVKIGNQRRSKHQNSSFMMK